MVFANTHTNILVFIFIIGLVVYWHCSKQECGCDLNTKKENLSITGFPPQKQSCIRYEGVGNMYEYCPRSKNWP